MLDLVKIEYFKDYFGIFCVIEEYLDINAYLKSFYCIYFCSYSVHQSTIYLYWSTFFLTFCVFFKHFKSVFEWARKYPKNHHLCSNDLLFNHFLCSTSHFWRLVVHLQSIKQKQFRKYWFFVNFSLILSKPGQLELFPKSSKRLGWNFHIQKNFAQSFVVVNLWKEKHWNVWLKSIL